MTTATARWGDIVVIAVLVLGLVAGCGTLLQPAGRSVVAPEDMRLSVSNGTELDVSILVNGEVVTELAPGTGKPDGIAADRLPALPWNVEARSLTGRVLLRLAVRQGDVWNDAAPNGGNAMQGVGARLDLSCGRLDVWSGPPLMGPAPGPGMPGDCEP